VVTATFQRLHVFVLLDSGTRHVVHWNLTGHPQRNEPSSSFGTVFPSKASIAFSSVVATASSRRRGRGPSVNVAPRVKNTGARAPQAKDYASYCTSLA
jgi:hypothetical protein